MRIALLVCDHVSEVLRKRHGDYVAMFQKLIPEYNLEPYHVIDNVFPAVDDYDAFVVTGSKHSVYDPMEWIENLKTLTREAFEKEKKYLGICFGHQMIAESLGGKVSKAEIGFLIGIHSFEIFHYPSWMNQKPPTYNVLMLCQDQVSKLPPHAQVLAESPTCPTGMMTIKKHILGIQGHPEFTKTYNQDVFESRVDRIGTAKVKRAQESLQGDPDTDWLHTVIIDFLRS